MLSSSLARVSAWLPAALALVALSSPSASGQVGPEESARKLKPAEGLEATLFAAEPMVINPTNIDVDSRGRVWVCEGLNYRYTLHREQPYLENADAIKVLEDTDGDGKADKVTIFADKIFPVPMGIAVEEVWDGKTYKGVRGDTVASALLADGIHLMGRSFKYHRPRGPVAAGSEEPNALIGTRRGPGRFEPNTRATVQELRAGLETTSQNRYPSLKFDVGAINDALGLRGVSQEGASILVDKAVSRITANVITRFLG